MIESLVPLKIPPGIFRNGTTYQAAGRWHDAQLVRFTENTIRPVGGWRRAQSPTGTDLPQLTGVPRRVLAWRADTGDYRIAIGTHSKVFMLRGSVVTDATPIGFAAGASSGSYSTGATTGDGPLMASLTPAATWQLDTFGDYLVGVAPHEGKLYVQPDPALPLDDPAGAPTGVRAVVTTPERFLFALGSTGNVRKVTWPSQETFTDWSPTGENTAGDFELTTDGALLAGRRTRGQTLLFTDVDLHAATYIGGNFLYRFDRIGENCGLIAPNAVAMVGDAAYWMGKGKFHVYDGAVRDLPSDVSDYVFSDFNPAQASQVWALPITQFGEVWFFYPSAAALAPDRYVIYNYHEQHWSIGALGRSAGVDAGVVPHPVLLSSDGYLYEHEYGTTRSGAAAPSLASGPIELGNGDQVLRVQRIVPDERTLGQTNVRFYTAFFPGETETMQGPFTYAAQPVPVRFTARQMRVVVTEQSASDWRVGTMRLGVVPGGRR